MWTVKNPGTMNYTSDGLGQALARAQIQGELAVQRASDIITHVGTADVATDIVTMNKAYGRDKFMYWGGSYGTLLGITYVMLRNTSAAPAN